MPGAERGRGPRPLAGLRAAGRGLLALPRLLPAVLALAWMGFIWRLSSASYAPGPAGLWYKTVANCAHAPLFGLLALFVAAAVLRSPARGAWPRLRRLDVALILGVVLVWGALDEWHQSRVPGREPALGDLATDVVGGASVVWIIAYLGRPDATDGGLCARLGAGVALCCAQAFLAALA
jgi:VanZ family protein